MSQSNAELLTEQHHLIKAGIHGLVDGSGSREELRESVLLLRKHIYGEETALFPVLDRDQRYWMALAQMRWEHGDMWPHIEACIDLLDKNAWLDDFIPAASTLLNLLHIHDPKEEEGLYAAAHLYQSGKDGPALAELFATPDLPSGWRCLRAPGPDGKPGDALVGEPRAEG